MTDTQEKAMIARAQIQLRSPLVGMAACRYAVKPWPGVSKVEIVDAELRYNADWVAKASMGAVSAEIEKAVCDDLTEEVIEQIRKFGGAKMRNAPLKPVAFVEDVEDEEDEDERPILYVSFNTADVIGYEEMTENAIEAYMTARGFADVGAGSGFGVRTLEYAVPEKRVVGEDMIRAIEAILSRQTGKKITLNWRLGEED